MEKKTTKSNDPEIKLIKLKYFKYKQQLNFKVIDTILLSDISINLLNTY